MIIVLLLFFQSICRFCQRIVLHIHDRWINPKNVRLLSEAAESAGNKIVHVKRSNRREAATAGLATTQTTTTAAHNYKRSRIAERKRASTSEENCCLDLNAAHNGFLKRSCRFCDNTPQGYCRHHLHLQELHVQRQQQTSWNPLAVQPNFSQAYRQLRKINRELRGNLKNRFNTQQQ